MTDILPYILFLGERVEAIQSVLGPFEPQGVDLVDQSKAAVKNSVFFADLMEGWDSGDPNGLRIDSFDESSNDESGSDSQGR